MAEFLSYFPRKLRDLLVGQPLGATLPERSAPRFPAADGRTAALRILRSYVAELTFWSAPRGKKPEAFRIQPKDVGSGDVKESFFIEGADKVDDLVMPSIVALPTNRVARVVHSFGTNVMESTRDVYGKGTVLVDLGTSYTEVVPLELWATNSAERRALLAGMRVALSPTENRPSLKLRMPDYFDRVATFTLLGEIRDDSDAALDRRKAQIDVDVRFQEVGLVNYVGFRPQLVVDVTDDPTATVDEE